MDEISNGKLNELPENLRESEISTFVHVEILQQLNSVYSKDALKNVVAEIFCDQKFSASEVIITEFSHSILNEHVVEISICNSEKNNLHEIDLAKSQVFYHVYKLVPHGGDMDDVEDEEDMPAAYHWILPNAEFHHKWESLVFDYGIKNELLSFVNTTLLFADHGIDPNLISCGKVVLLHGPPGTGKTTLCKALAQKLSIHLSHQFTYGQLIEINSHSLFSKWFSESGKLVLKMFDKIQELMLDSKALVFVLIDEVESLTRSRLSCNAGGEPSDAVRVVNALLTQLDQIRKYPNVLILTTSNISDTIDLAFVDRADIRQYIGLPSPDAIYKIYASALRELMKGIIYPQVPILSLSYLQTSNVDVISSALSLQLQELARQSIGLSGRTLRKLPLLAHALYLTDPVVTFPEFLIALKNAIGRQFQEKSKLSVLFETDINLSKNIQ